MRQPLLSDLCRSALLLGLLLAALWLAGCEIADPELPRFDTRVALPLGEERLDIADTIDDEDYLVALADGTLGFTVDGDPDTVGLDLDLGTDFAAQTVSGDLGNFALDLAAPPPFAFTLGDLYPAAVSLDGLSVPVPGFTFTTASDPENLADLESATLAGGTLVVTVLNGLPVPVSASSGPERLLLELIDPASGGVIVALDFDPIAAGAQAQREADLAGVTLPGAIAVRLTGGSIGSGGAPVTVDAGAAIAVSAGFHDLEVSAAEAVVEAQSFTTSFLTALPDDYEIERAVIGSGAVSLSLRNEMAIPCQASVTWPQVVDLDDQPMQLVVDLEGGGSASRVADFAGYIVKAPGGSVLTELTAEVVVTSPGSDGQPVLLQADQGIQADLGAGHIEFTSVTGTVPELSFTFAPMNEEIDLPDELEGLLLTRATLVLELTNTAGLAAEADFDLVGINDSGTERNLQVQQPIEPAEAGRAAVTRIVLDETNSTIVDFLNNLPTEISLTGGVNLGGDGQSGTIRAGDYAVVNWEIVSPVEVIVESSHLYGDPEDLDLDQDARDLITDHVGAAELQLAVLNHLPVGVETRLLFGTDSETMKTAPLLAIGPVTVDAGVVDPIEHTVLEPRTSHPVINLTAAETAVLATEGLLSMLEVVLPSSEGSPVRVMTTDYVTVQGLIYLDVAVHDD
jgi:hypothetical protein